MLLHPPLGAQHTVLPWEVCMCMSVYCCMCAWAAAAHSAAPPARAVHPQAPDSSASSPRSCLPPPSRSVSTPLSSSTPVLTVPLQPSALTGTGALPQSVWIVALLSGESSVEVQ